MAGDEGSSTTGGSSGENEGTSRSAASHKASKASPNKPSASAKKAEGKLSNPNSKGGKGRGY